MKRSLLGALAVLSSTAIAADSVQLKPGRWIETAVPDWITISGTAVPLPSKDPQTKHVCLTEAEAADPKLYFATIKDKDRCGVPTGDVAAGKIALIGSCVTDGAKDTSSQIAIDGSYGGERYSANAKMNADMDGKPMVVMLSIEGRFDGACRGDEEKRSEAK